MASKSHSTLQKPKSHIVVEAPAVWAQIDLPGSKTGTCHMQMKPHLDLLFTQQSARQCQVHLTMQIPDGHTK